MRMKFNDNGKEYDGLVWIGPTDKTHCERCERGASELPTGIAVHFYDKAKDHKVVTGRTCFKKLVDGSLTLGQIPVFGMGFDGAQFSNNSSTQQGRQTAKDQFTVNAIANAQDARTLVAMENVFLRVELENNLGFTKLGQARYLNRFYSKMFNEGLSVTDVGAIESVIERGIREYKKPSIHKVRDLHVVALQVKSLGSKQLDDRDRKSLGMLSSELRKYMGLTDKQMEWVEKIADKHDIKLSSKGIRFPENQARVERRSTP